MLSRTADSLFWMARYVERAENTARLIDMARRMSATPDARAQRRSQWREILTASGSGGDFASPEDDPSEGVAAVAYLMTDPDNPSSVRACFANARANARAARAALTVEMWEAVNDAWDFTRRLRPTDLDNGAMSPLLDDVKRRGALLRGAADSTALRNDGYDFFRLGGLIERLDSIARLVQVKTALSRGPGRDFDAFEWIAVLRAAGVLRAYQAAYRVDYDRERILHFLIANPYCPRSLSHCARQIAERLDSLAWFYGGRRRCHDEAAALVSRLIDEPSPSADPDALDAFLGWVLRRNNALALAIAESYHFAPKAPEEIVTEQAEAGGEDGDLFETGLEARDGDLDGGDDDSALDPDALARLSIAQKQRQSGAGASSESARGVAAE